MIDRDKLLSETFLCHVEWLDQVDSTNTRAIQLSRFSSVATPFIVGAAHQTAGRGRGTNRWWASDGALTFTVAIDMPQRLSSIAWPRFSLMTGLAIAETLSKFLPLAQVGLKWPNDVWLNGRKVCGILIEQADLRPGRFVVGIGLNVNNSFRDAPAELRSIATSMSDETDGGTFDFTDLLVDLMNRWEFLLKELETDTVNLVERWSHACVLSGRPVTVSGGDRELTGICAGIDEDGSLLLRTAFTTERCYAGTVRLLD